MSKWSCNKARSPKVRGGGVCFSCTKRHLNTAYARSNRESSTRYIQLEINGKRFRHIECAYITPPYITSFKPNSLLLHTTTKSICNPRSLQSFYSLRCWSYHFVTHNPLDPMYLSADLSEMATSFQKLKKQCPQCEGKRSKELLTCLRTCREQLEAAAQS